MILENIEFADHVARKTGRGLPLADVGMTDEDCVQLGRLGLTQAAARFDASDHDHERASIRSRFQSYAYLRIRGAVIDECRRLGGEQRQLPPTTLSLDHEDGGENLSFSVEDRDSWIDFRTALGGLTEQERYAAVGMLAGVPQTEMAPALGVSETRMQQIARSTRERLAESMERTPAAA